MSLLTCSFQLSLVCCPKLYLSISLVWCFVQESLWASQKSWRASQKTLASLSIRIHMKNMVVILPRRSLHILRIDSLNILAFVGDRLLQKKTQPYTNIKYIICSANEKLRIMLTMWNVCQVLTKWIWKIFFHVFEHINEEFRAESC